MKLTVLLAAILLVTLVVDRASASTDPCCCACESIGDCYPSCSTITDFESCELACLVAECGHAVACPDPSQGQGCGMETVSCVDVNGPTPTGVATATATVTPVPTATLIPNGGACTNDSQCLSRMCSDNRCAPATGAPLLSTRHVAFVVAVLLAVGLWSIRGLARMR
ncbi:hypothetical protein KF840_09505 [bacterium]|nr:hypothetical protein [bacterium]